MSHKKLLVLVHRGMTASQIEAAVDGIGDRLLTDLGIPSITLLDSASWYREAFPAAGTWDAWIWESVSGKNFQTREPHFAGFVVCGDMLGRANAQIVELALRSKRPALQWTSDRHPLRVVSKVVTADADNWTSGWRVESNALGD